MNKERIGDVIRSVYHQIMTEEQLDRLRIILVDSDRVVVTAGQKGALAAETWTVELT